jgi:hypothetical protein
MEIKRLLFPLLVEIFINKLTHDQTEEITKEGKKILVMPVFKWLLQL